MSHPAPTVVAALRRAGLATTLALALLGPRPTTAAAQPGTQPGPGPQMEPAVPAPASADALTDADLDRLARALRAADPKERLAAAQAVAAAHPDGLPTYAAWLRRPLLATKETFRVLIHGIWGQYPNPDYPKGPGKDPPMWLVRQEPKWTPPPRVPGKPRPQRPPKHDPEAVDWLRALAELDLAADEQTAASPAQELGAARAEALLRVALLRAIAAAGARGRRDAVQPLFDFAFVEEGIFRDECGRMIRSMGSYAVPTLVRIYHDRTRGNAKMRRYAAYQMDRMDRLRPGKALAAAADDATRAEILRAYGDARALDAVSHRVRREARRAWLRYVDGPPPPPSPKRKRKLPGGAEEAEEKEDYLNYREMATLEVRKVLKEQSGREPDPSLTAKQMTDQLLAIYDARREQQFGQLFQRAAERERAGDLSGAVDDFGWILANQPDHPRRAEMAGAFLRLGEQLADEGERQGEQAMISRALGLMRQGLAMTQGKDERPAQPALQRAQARVHYLDGRQAQRQGGDGTPDFALAVAADPGYLAARQALETARLRAGHPGSGWAILISGALGLLLMLGASLWFARSAFVARPRPPTQ